MSLWFTGLKPWPLDSVLIIHVSKSWKYKLTGQASGVLIPHTCTLKNDKNLTLSVLVHVQNIVLCWMISLLQCNALRLAYSVQEVFVAPKIDLFITLCIEYYTVEKDCYF